MVTQPAPRRPGRPSVLDTRAVSAGALRLWADRGFATTSWNDLAEATGISTRTLLRHFSSRSEIAWIGVAPATERLQSALGAAAPEDLRITGDPSSVGLEVSLDSQLSMIYRLQKTLSLEKPDWRNCGPALRGTNDPLLLPEPSPGGERGYYRVLAWPSPPP